jgi:ubiquinone/menaquinone biosynthesis C-methylase UbiE
MALFDLFAQNALVRWIRGDRHQYDLAIAMTGVRLGERVLQIGCTDAGLLAALGAKVGLTGQACGVDPEPGLARSALTSAEAAGVLVETTAAPYAQLGYDTGSFDLVVVRRAGTLLDRVHLGHALQEACRVLRPGGRCIVAGGGRGAPRDAEAVVKAALDAGFRGARVLAERDGWTFVEGLKLGNAS